MFGPEISSDISLSFIANGTCRPSEEFPPNAQTLLHPGKSVILPFTTTVQELPHANPNTVA